MVGSAGSWPTTSPAAWLSAARSGSCGLTFDAERGDCEHGELGAFGLPRAADTWESAVQQCLSLCSRCAGCNFVSVSPRWHDCSWYRHCGKLSTDVEDVRSAAATSDAAPPDRPPMPHYAQLATFAARWTQPCVREANVRLGFNVSAWACHDPMLLQLVNPSAVRPSSLTHGATNERDYAIDFMGVRVPWEAYCSDSYIRQRDAHTIRIAHCELLSWASEANAWPLVLPPPLVGEEYFEYTWQGHTHTVPDCPLTSVPSPH